MMMHISNNFECFLVIGNLAVYVWRTGV